MRNLNEMPARLEQFLSRRLPGAAKIVVSDYTTMTGGYSRLMARFTATIDGVRHHLVVRGDPPPEQTYIDTDRALEWEVLSVLKKHSTKVAPDVWGFDADGSELGTKAIVMDLIGDGSSLLHLLRNSSDVEKLDKFCDLAVRVHAVDINRLPAALERPTDWNAYIDTLIDTWRLTEAEHNESAPFFRYMAAWLDANRPPPAPFTLVHGELHPSNVVVDSDGTFIAIDWELPHIGDPREEFGWCKFVGSVVPPDIIGIDEVRFCQRYCEKTGLGPEIVNPLTLGYFSILSTMRMFRQVLEQQRAFVDGTNNSLRPGYTTLAVITAHEQWYRATQAIEAATKGTRRVAS